MKRKYKSNLKRKIRQFSALLVACMLLVCTLPVWQAAAADKEEVIEINTVEDLLNLAVNCKSDAWSVGKTVELMADLNIKDSGFSGIPVFSGNFNGNGHKITGFELEGAGFADGFFRYVSMNAEVKNLTVEGIVKTEEEGECVGGIVGINRGTLVNCVFSGTVTGKSSVAAIAGENTKSGIIRSCTANGTVDAPYEVGGIAGTNHGIIRSCKNNAVINNDKAFIDEMDEESTSWIIGSISLDSDVRITAGTDVGGIAGYSDGSIFNCINYATVGYEHTGYNVGGIVGRQGGVVSSCTNNGKVLGRKDVGGIVGQMEPFISVDEAASISDAVRDLHDLVEKLLDDLSESEKGVSSDLDDIKKHTDNALDLGNDISQELIDFTNSNIDAMNLLADEISYVIENLPDIIDSLDLSVAAARRFGDDLKKINDDLDILEKLDKTAYSETKYKRLTLTSAVGGSISSDNMNPEKNIKVRLTVNLTEGYRLSTLAIYDANGRSVEYSKNSDGSYEFIMPEENVVVRSTYTYVGNFFIETNAGGSLSKAYSTDKEMLKLTVRPDGGYTFDSVKVGENEYNRDSFNYDETKNEYVLEVSEKKPEGAVYISTEFVKEESSHTVTVVSSTGGLLSADKVLSSKDEVVKVTVTEAANYVLSSLTLVYGGQSFDLIAERSAEDALANPNEYSFVMPEENVKVEAVFKYNDEAKNNEETVLYTESTIGGTMYYVKNPTTNDYIIYIIPEAGYEVSATDAIAIFSGAKAGQESANPVGSLSTDQLTQYGNGYTYTLNYTQFETPIRAYGSFVKVEAANSVLITTSTGGTASVDLVAAKAGETVNLAAVPNNGYRIKKISILSGSEEIEYRAKEDLTNVYEFTMPDGNVDITVEFAPIVFIVTSNYGGTVSVTANGDTLKFTVSPDDGYTLDGAPTVLDAEGNIVTLVKRTAGVFAYEFDLTDLKAPISTEINFVGATDYEVVENSADNIDEQAQKLSTAMSDIQKTVDEINALVTDDYGNVIDVETFISNTDKVNELIKLIVRLAKEVAEAGEAASSLISSLNTLSNVLVPYMTDAAKAVNEDVEQAIDDLDECLSYLQQAGNQTQAVLDYLNSQPSVKFTDLSKNFSNNVSSLTDEMKKISDGMGKINTDFSKYTDTILDDFRAINDKTNDILQLIIDIVNNVENAYLGDDGIYEDVSDEELENVTDGKVSGCTNNGAVRADLNVGGVVGSMSIDTEDPEDNAAGSVDWNIRNSYLTKCVLTSCTNNGKIVAKSDGVGSIAGYQGIGVINACTAYGTAESTEGEYVGGIAGHSKAIIRNCNSLCTLSGSRYIGGIAGYGYKLSNNYSIAMIDEATTMVGAIAGQVKFEENEHAVNVENVYENKYVSSWLGGIDGISYEGIAEEITYQELLEIPGVSNGFSHLYVVFRADGRIIGKEEYEYGQSLESVSFPRIPEIEGYYGRWPDVTGMVIEGNLILEAEYFPNISTVKSDTYFTDSSEDGNNVEKNLVLIDGVFDSNAKLLVSMNKESFPEELSAGQKTIVYTVSLEGAKAEEKAKIRLYNPGKTAVKVYEKTSAGWVEIESVEYGSYEQVVLKNGIGTFALVEQKTSYMKYIVIGACVAGFILLIVIIKLIVAAVKKHKNRKKNK